MSENHQIVENPLLLTELFRQGVYYFGEQEGSEIVAQQLVVNQAEKEVVAAAESADVSPKTVSNDAEIIPEGNEINEESDEEMINLTIINLFFDPADAQWDESIQTSYNKLMTVVKVNQEAVISEDIESIVVSNQDQYSVELLGDRISPVIFVWSDRAIAGVPDMYKARPTEKGVVLRFPAFASMCADVEMKKMVWQTMKTVLKF